jgi:hypothetical protein
MNIFDLLKQYQQEQGQARGVQVGPGRADQAQANIQARDRAIMAQQNQERLMDNQMAQQAALQASMRQSGGIPSGEENMPQSEKARIAYRMAQLNALGSPGNSGTPGADRALQMEQLALAGNTMAESGGLFQQPQGHTISDSTPSIGGGIKSSFDTSKINQQRPRFSYGDYERQKREREMDELKSLTQKKAQKALQGIFDTGSSSYLARLLSKLGM